MRLSGSCGWVHLRVLTLRPTIGEPCYTVARGIKVTRCLTKNLSERGSLPHVRIYLSGWVE